jgi:Mitochondrial carrier protein
MSEPELSVTASFLCGAVSSVVGESVTFPMDLMKTRMQLGGTQGSIQYKSLLHVISHTYKIEKFSSFYKGASPALIRQFFYSGIRMLVFDKGKVLFGYNNKNQDFWPSFVLGGLGGGIGSLVTTPFDVCKIRLINDTAREKYKGLADCLRKTLKNEGIFYGFYKGSSPNVYRALIINATSLATYDSSKALFSSYNIKDDSYLNRFCSSFLTGFVCSVVSSPIDVVKTRYMNAAKFDNMPKFSGPTDCFIQIFKNEGILSFYKGFFALWLRIGPYSVIMYMTWDYLKDISRKLNL